MLAERPNQADAESSQAGGRARTSASPIRRPQILEHFEANPEALPPNLRVTVTPDKSAELMRLLEVQVIGKPWSINDLVSGMEVLGLTEPAFDQPMAEAASLGCSEDALLAGMRARSEELEAQGTAGEFFIQSITSR